MSNLGLQNYNPQYPVINQYPPQTMAYAPNMQGMPPSMQGLDYDSLKLQAQDNAVAQAARHYDAENPATTLSTMAKSFLYSLLMSVGFTGATNWLMSSKNFVDGVTNVKDFTQTRLYKAGQVLDDKIGDSRVVQGAQKAVTGIRGFFSKITPNVVKEAVAKMRMGSIAVWDKQGMFHLGKGAEALNDFVTATTQVPTDKIKALLTANGAADKIDDVLDIINKVKKGSIRGTVAFDKLYPIFDKLPAKELAKLNEQGWFGKLLGLRTDLSNGLHKAKFFNGSLNKAQGPIARLFQKMSALVGEASGNGVLGGKMALFMGSFGLMQGFNAAANAEKGDKLKAFMEDYIGFTLGSYLMSFVVGTWFNKFLGVTELGMNVNSKQFKDACKQLGLDPSNTKRVQEAVIAFNREFKDIRKAQSIIEKLKSGKIAKADALKEIKKLVNNKNLKIDNLYDSISQTRLIEKVESRVSQFVSNGSIRANIKSAMKSNLTLKEAGFGRYIVQKPLELMGKVLSVGRYSMMDGSQFSLKSMGKFTKRFGGGVGRMILVGFVLVEPFRKGFMKLSHAIFGKPKNSALDEGKEKTAQNAQENKQLQQLLAQQQAAQQAPQQPIAPQQMQQAAPQPINATPLNNSQPIAAAPMNTASANNTTNSIDDAIAATELRRSYIPSAQPSQFALQKDPRELEVESAILKAERAEHSAQNFLSRGI